MKTWGAAILFLASAAAEAAPICPLPTGSVFAQARGIWSVAAAGPEEAPMAPWLNCLNRLRPPLATGLYMAPDGESREIPPSRQTNIFFAGQGERRGFFVIGPNRAWFSRPPARPDSGGTLGYSLFFRNGEGVDRLFHYFVHPGDQSSSVGPGARGQNFFSNEIEFNQVGKPGDEISDEQARTATREQIMRRMETMPNSIASAIRTHQELGRQDVGPRMRDEAKTVLCECAKIGDPLIDGLARSVASRLEIRDAHECFSPLMSALDARSFL